MSFPLCCEQNRTWEDWPWVIFNSKSEGCENHKLSNENIEGDKPGL